MTSLSHPDHRPTVVCFANALLPDSDYRVAFARYSTHFRVVLALPGRPPTLPEKAFTRIDIGPALPLRSLLRMLRIPGILGSERADFAIFFGTQFATFGPWLARCAGVKPLITITGLGRSFSLHGVRGVVARGVYLGMFFCNSILCRTVLFQNPADLRLLTRRLPGPLRKKCHLIGSGIDISFFPGIAHHSSRRPRCIMVGRLLPEKGIGNYLTIAAELRARADFWVIGPASSNHPETLFDVETADRNGVVTYLGALTSQEVREQMAEAMVLVLSSRSEGLPRVALEAAMSGVAVAAYDIPGCRAALGPDHPLAPVGDCRSLARLVERLLTRRDLRESVVRSSRAYVLQNISANAYIKRLEHLLL